MAIGDKFDVFISHSNEDKRWVLALANNLKRSGLSVWLDLLDAVAGVPIAGQRQKALGSSRRALLVATPNGLDTWWLQEQIESMRVRQQADPDFLFIPLFFGATEGGRWIASPLSVDFSRSGPVAYRASFRNLMNGLSKRSGEPVEIPSDLEIPRPHLPQLQDMASRPLTQGEADSLDLVFTILAGNRPVLLLAPTDHDKTPIHRAILAEAQTRFGAGNVLHLVPPGNVEASKSEYFGFLCEQIAKGRNLNKASEFESVLENLIARGNSIFLFMSRIEDGSAEGRRALSHSLRNLGERYHDWLNVVLCGSENLLELRYKEGNLSPMRKAETVILPEPRATDIKNWQGSDAAGLTEAEASSLLRLTGGNARLIQQGLKSRETFNPLDEAVLARKLGQDALLRARFAAYRETGEAGRVASLLLREDLGHYNIWPIQALLRRLYWDGLLIEDQGRFRWRCELVRQIGREVMGV